MTVAFAGVIIATRAVGGPLPTIYHLNLQYTSGLPAAERYDERHVAVCLQGLANREAPRVFLSFHSTDNVWLTRLREPGGLCEGWTLQNLQSIEEYISIFAKYATGVVLYDPDPNTGVISSSLVATTAAGVENAIAVRKDTSAGSMYNYLVNDASGPQLPVLFDLTGKFTGSGTIWQTTTPSTGSAKCDAYIWAKEKYIDTGKCDPTVLMYTLDLWGLKEGADLRSQLSNLDYAVQKKGFCFELSPWGDEIATDDPGQPLGTDLATFKNILNACNLQTGKSRMIKFCGFTNWDYKYTSNGSVGGSHGEVATEWETARLLSAYNAYLEADAPSMNYLSSSSFYSGLAPETEMRRYVQNPAPTFSALQAKGYIDGSGNVADGNYILIGMGDYDQSSWTLNWLASGIYNDSNRGNVECSWGIDPNAIDRASVAIDYMYRHKTAKDYFMAWDSGAGYVHPTQLYGTRAPSYYSSAVDVWQDHCRKYYRMLDYSISGWLLNEGSGWRYHCLFDGRTLWMGAGGALDSDPAQAKGGCLGLQPALPQCLRILLPDALLQGREQPPFRGSWRPGRCIPSPSLSATMVGTPGARQAFIDWLMPYCRKGAPRHQCPTMMRPRPTVFPCPVERWLIPAKVLPSRSVLLRQVRAETMTYIMRWFTTGWRGFTCCIILNGKRPLLWRRTKPMSTPMVMVFPT